MDPSRDRDRSRKRSTSPPNGDRDKRSRHDDSHRRSSHHHTSSHTREDNHNRDHRDHHRSRHDSSSSHHHRHHDSHHNQQHNSNPSASQPAPAHSQSHSHHRDSQSRQSRPPPPSTASSSQPAPTSTPAAPKSSSAYEKYRSLGDMKYPWMRDSTEYDKLATIGRGTFGEVFKAKAKHGDRIVALKKILMENEKEGFPITALREIKILQHLKNENVVELVEICSSKLRQVPFTASEFNRFRSTFYLVFEFCEHDLAGLLSNKQLKFTAGEVKGILKQLLNGLYFIHFSKVLHRDMKTSNILITKDGILKIADFGLARAFSKIGTKEKPNRFTNRVVTLWYRPPELLLGERNYTPAIDIWGAGCIMCELWTRTPILQGKDEQHQLDLITQLCGSITPEVYPDVAKLELYKSMKLPTGVRRNFDRLRSFVKDDQAVDLLEKIFTIDPNRRINAENALDHDYFWTSPDPQDLKDKMKTITRSQFELTANHEMRHQQHPGNRAPTQHSNMHNFKPPQPGMFGDRVF